MEQYAQRNVSISQFSLVDRQSSSNARDRPSSFDRAPATGGKDDDFQRGLKVVEHAVLSM